MPSRSEIRTSVKTMIGRDFDGINTVLDEYIVDANEYFANSISAIYDIKLWEHEITSSDNSGDVNNWQLPVRLKGIQDAYYVDESADEKVFFKIDVVSPTAFYNDSRNPSSSRGAGFAAGQRVNWTSSASLVPAYYRTRNVARVDWEGIPYKSSRIGQRFYVHPRPGAAEVGNKIRLTLQMKPDELTGDGSENTITTHYSRPLILYTAGMFWSLYYGNLQTGQLWLRRAGDAMAAFATQDEINKLINLTVGDT